MCDVFDVSSCVMHVDVYITSIVAQYIWCMTLHNMVVRSYIYDVGC